VFFQVSGLVIHEKQQTVFLLLLLCVISCNRLNPFQTQRPFINAESTVQQASPYNGNSIVFWRNKICEQCCRNIFTGFFADMMSGMVW
jgi:hypothetical protein